MRSCPLEPARRPPGRRDGPGGGHVVSCWCLLLALGPVAAAPVARAEVEPAPLAGRAETGTEADAGTGAGAEGVAPVIDRVAPQVERIRALTFVREVPVRVVDEAAARRHMIARFERFQLRDRLEATTRAYALLGLVPDDLDVWEAVLDAVEEQVGGFYDPEAGAFYVLDHLPAEAAPLIVAHELTHALEDQHYDLDARIADAIDDDDRVFALGSLHEGSATLVMASWAMEAIGRGELTAAALEALGSVGAAGEAFAALPEVLQRQFVGPYVLGAGFLARGGPLAMLGPFPAEDVGRAFARPPVSSEQILHPERYWDAGERDAPTLVPPGPPVLGRGWTRRADGVLGEVTLALLVPAPAGTEAPAAGSPEWLMGQGWTHAAADGWDGDRWELWTRGERAVVLLRTVWDSPREAEEFAAALERAGRMRWRREGDRVVAVAGEAPPRPDRTLERMLR